MHKFNVYLILEPHHKDYCGRRYLQMADIEASCEKDAIKKVKGYMYGMLQDYVELIIDHCEMVS